MLTISELPANFDKESINSGSVEFIEMSWDERRQTRRRYLTNLGTEIALALPRGTVLTDHLILYTDRKLTVIVRAKHEPILVIKPRDAVQSCTVTHHLGNWHRSLQVINELELVTEDDRPLRAYLEKSNIDYSVEERVYQPNLNGIAHDSVNFSDLKIISKGEK